MQDLAGTVRHGPEEPGGNPASWISSDSHVWILGATHMKTLFVRFVKNESGATAIEYGLIAAGISVAIIAVVNGLGTQLNTTFGNITTSLKNQ
jgi:pilus assembly protein Flp/PilA